MKNWENRLSGLLLIAAGIIFLVLLAFNFWLFPPGHNLEPVELESSIETMKSSSVPEMPGPINLNTATLEELDSLPGIGEVLAQRILDYREEHGGFQSLEDLMKVDGIGESTFEELKGKITLE